MKKRKQSSIRRPKQEDKSGKAPHASTSELNSSTNNTHEEDVNMPQGAESDYKNELLDNKKQQVNGSVPKRPEQ